MSKIERPEALAQFAESARRGEREGVAGLVATHPTEPIPTDPKAKDEAATRILAEGATGEDQQSEAVVNQLPDRILESQQKSRPEHIEASPDTSLSFSEAPYDATRDPRTGRPPSPLEAQRIAQENELARLSRAAVTTGNERHDEDEAINAMHNADDEDLDPGSPPDQAPARMVSPKANQEETAAADELVNHGVARERAEEPCQDAWHQPGGLACGDVA